MEDRRDATTRLFALAHDAEDEQRRGYEDEIIRLNMVVARDCARRYRGRGIADDDLDQVAYVGLVKAVRGFDPERGFDFLSFAVPTVRGELRRHFRDHGWTIRPPRRVQEIQSKVIHAYRHGEESGAPPSAAKLALELDLPESDVAEALQAEGCFTPVSLDVPVSEDGRAAIDRLAADETEGSAMEARLMLSPALRRLSPRDRKILRLRFVEDKTQQEIGDALGVTQMQVSRLLTRILGTLRTELEAS